MVEDLGWLWGTLAFPAALSALSQQNAGTPATMSAQWERCRASLSWLKLLRGFGPGGNRASKSPRWDLRRGGGNTKPKENVRKCSSSDLVLGQSVPWGAEHHLAGSRSWGGGCRKHQKEERGEEVEIGVPTEGPDVPHCVMSQTKPLLLFCTGLWRRP